MLAPRPERGRRRSRSRSRAAEKQSSRCKQGGIGRGRCQAKGRCDCDIIVALGIYYSPEYPDCAGEKLYRPSTAATARAHDDAQEAGGTHDTKLANRKSRELEAKQRQSQRSRPKGKKTTAIDQHSVQPTSRADLRTGVARRYIIGPCGVCSLFGRRRTEAKEGKKDGDLMDAIHGY